MHFNLLLSLIFLLAIAMRLIYFNDGLTFGYDQARDMFQALEIWNKDPIKLIGPQSDRPGLHHGSFYWYLISPAVNLSGGDVWVTRFYLILISCITIFFIYDLTKSLFPQERRSPSFNNKIAILASFLFAISFEATEYARWLSNPPSAILTSTISFWSLQKLIDGKKWALATLLFSWGLSVQFQLFMLYQLVVFPLVWVILKGFTLPKLSKQDIVIAVVAFLVSIFSFIATEFTFRFQNTTALWKLVGSNTNINASFSNILITFFDRLVHIFYVNIWGINIFFAGIISIVTLTLSLRVISSNIKYKKSILFLVLWIISPIFLHFFIETNINYVALGVGVGAIILTSYFLFEFLKSPALRWVGLIAVLIIVVGNINLILRFNKTGEALFSVQQKVNLKDELEVIDWIYNQAGGKPFYLNTITNPAFINTTWSYLFNWYGRSKYGYMPIWWGETQVGVYGSNVVYSEKKETDLHFLIIEPTVGREDVTEAVKYLEDSRSKVVTVNKVGTFTVEKRQITNPRIFTNQDVFYFILNKTSILLEESAKDR